MFLQSISLLVLLINCMILPAVHSCPNLEATITPIDSPLVPLQSLSLSSPRFLLDIDIDAAGTSLLALSQNGSLLFSYNDGLAWEVHNDLLPSFNSSSMRLSAIVQHPSNPTYFWVIAQPRTHSARTAPPPTPSLDAEAGDPASDELKKAQAPLAVVNIWSSILGISYAPRPSPVLSVLKLLPHPSLLRTLLLVGLPPNSQAPLLFASSNDGVSWKPIEFSSSSSSSSSSLAVLDVLWTHPNATSILAFVAGASSDSPPGDLYFIADAFSEKPSPALLMTQIDQVIQDSPLSNCIYARYANSSLAVSTTYGRTFSPAFIWPPPSAVHVLATTPSASFIAAQAGNSSSDAAYSLMWFPRTSAAASRPAGFRYVALLADLARSADAALPGPRFHFCPVLSRPGCYLAQTGAQGSAAGTRTLVSFNHGADWQPLLVSAALCAARGVALSPSASCALDLFPVVDGAPFFPVSSPDAPGILAAAGYLGSSEAAGGEERAAVSALSADGGASWIVVAEGHRTVGMDKMANVILVMEGNADVQNPTAFPFRLSLNEGRAWSSCSFSTPEAFLVRSSGPVMEITPSLRLIQQGTSHAGSEMVTVDLSGFLSRTCHENEMLDVSFPCNLGQVASFKRRGEYLCVLPPDFDPSWSFSVCDCDMTAYACDFCYVRDADHLCAPNSADACAHVHAAPPKSCDGHYLTNTGYMLVPDAQVCLDDPILTPPPLPVVHACPLPSSLGLTQYLLCIFLGYVVLGTIGFFIWMCWSRRKRAPTKHDVAAVKLLNPLQDQDEEEGLDFDDQDLFR